MDNILLKVTRIVKETADSKTFYFDTNGSPFSYKAGQFLTIILELDNKEVRRAYSFGSTPEVDKDLFITFKRVSNGRASRFLYDKITAGTLLKALPSAGRFTLEENIAVYFFIAAGSGITPVFSLIKEILFKQPKSKVILIYQNNNEADSIYRKQLVDLQNKFPSIFNLIEIFSNPVEHIHQPHRLNNYSLEQILLKQVSTTDIIFYLCGPKEFMRMAEFTLRVLGYENAQIRKENFVVDFVPLVPFITDTTPKNVKLNFNDKTHYLTVAYPHNILEVALKNNIQLPYSCRGGRCSTCAATCISGKVKMSINEVLTEKDLANGLILTCVGYPETDIELVFD